MKNIFTLIAFLTLTMAATAQSSVTKVNKKMKTAATNSATAETGVVAATVTPKESLTLKESEHDFGKIPQGKPVTYNFEFTNTGTVPFALSNVRASCGCTTPVWNRDTVAAGATAIIKVGYNAANEGPFTKPVTITYNVNNNQHVKQIIIKGEVWKTPVTSAPVNTSLNALKQDQ